MIQYWHLNTEHAEHVRIETKDSTGVVIEPIIEEKWYSGYYGIKEKSLRFAYKTRSNRLSTTIKINN